MTDRTHSRQAEHPSQPLFENLITHRYNIISELEYTNSHISLCFRRCG